ncbi:ABC transporter ATP-binding protein [Spongiactinospora gelatinilytica]|uniref:ABC transporter ATP-binding protein n=1 Tax=Spongiactinospora gelatinilytica TaxID=2666298 RepID=UPI001F482417|nr:ABC transporter ATP-binding protein [Spongiactinospora gelatinilytica]
MTAIRRESALTVTGARVELGGNLVLDGVDLSAATGEAVAIMGDNGVGKSTLLRGLAGLQRLDSGEIDVLGGGAPSDDAAFWGEVVLVADEPGWYPGLTVEEHLGLVQAVYGATRMTAADALAAFHLRARADVAPLNLSTGQRQRLSLAMALLRPSRLLLLDEPERGLDAGFRPRLGEILREYTAAGGTVVMATHDPRLAEAAAARLVRLAEGRAVAR